MSVGDLMGIAAAAVAGLSALSGGVWWLASLHGTVRGTATDVGHIGKGVRAMQKELVDLNQSVRDHAQECDRNRIGLDNKTADHEQRIRSLET